MENRFGYDEDVYRWSREQADALRRLAAARRDLPNELDLDHIAEEIEEVGRSGLNAVASLLVAVMTHLIKLASVGDDALPAARWRAEIAAWHPPLLLRYLPSMRQSLDMERLWRMARRSAAAALNAHGDEIVALSDACPFAIDDFTAEEIVPVALVQRLRTAAIS